VIFFLDHVSYIYEEPYTITHVRRNQHHQCGADDNKPPFSQIMMMIAQQQQNEQAQHQQEQDDEHEERVLGTKISEKSTGGKCGCIRTPRLIMLSMMGNHTPMDPPIIPPMDMNQGGHQVQEDK